MRSQDGSRIWTFAVAAGAAALFGVHSAHGQLPKVLIVHAQSTSIDANILDVQSKLMATGRFQAVDFFNSVDTNGSTPTMCDLLPYDAVLTWSNSNYHDSTALGNVLADYIDAGRGVVVASFTPHASTTARRLQGRWISGGYEIIVAPAGAQSLNTAASLGAIALPASPVIQNVVSLSGTGPFRPNLNCTLTAHGELVASWNNGSILAATSTTHARRVDIGMIPMSSDATAAYWNSAGDGDVLLANALEYAAPDPGSPLPPAGCGTVSQRPAAAGTNVVVAVDVYPGVAPASTGITVTADLSAFGGSSTQALALVSGNRYEYVLAVPLAQPTGAVTFPYTVSDAQVRTTSSTMSMYVIAPPPADHVVETEANDSKATADAVTLSPGQGVHGISTGVQVSGTGLVATSDYFRITTPTAAPGIYRHRMVINTTGTAGHTGTIRGLDQVTGVISAATDVALQTSTASTSPARMNQWYGFGQGESIYYRVTGGTTTTSEYSATFESTAVTPVEAASTVQPGDVTIARIAGATTAQDMWLYNGSFQAIVDAGMEGTTQAFTRTLTPGTYYLAVSNVNLANNLVQPADSTARSSDVFDFPNAVMNSSTTLVANLGVTITHAGGTFDTALAKTEPFEIVWLKFIVPGGPIACNAADLATAGNPDPNAGPDGFLTGDDFDLFINAFFNELQRPNGSFIADLVDGDGNPPPDGFLTGSDFDYFLGKFFEGC